MRISLVVLVLALAGLLAVDLEPSAAPRKAEASLPQKATKPAPRIVEVAFVRNGRLIRVERVVPENVAPEVHALRELVQGPTRVERRKGIRTAIPEGARVRSVRADGELWIASLSRSTFGVGAPQTKRTRLLQIAATLTPLGPQAYAVVATEGRLVTTLRLGMRPDDWRAEIGENDYPYLVRGVQLRLWTLGYLERSDVTGTLGYLTEQALLAFQGWEDLDRTGTVTGQTQVARTPVMRTPVMVMSVMVMSVMPTPTATASSCSASNSPSIATPPRSSAAPDRTGSPSWPPCCIA